MTTVFAAVDVSKPKQSNLTSNNEPTFAKLPEEEEKSLLSSENSADEKRRRTQGLWVIDGVAYDFTDFVNRHPGGSAAIGLGRGLDCTELFKTYHLLRSPPESILKKYRLPNPDNFDYGLSKYSFEQDGFLNTVRQRGRDYFKKNNINSKGSLVWQIGTILTILLIAGLMYPAFVLGLWYVALIHGLVKGVTAVTSGHSMSHFALFAPWLNSYFFRGFSPLVISTHEIWSTSHIVSHHIHTLTKEDLQDNYPIKRVQPSMPFKWFHRFQHIYIWGIYLFGLPLWTMSDFVESIPVLFTGKHAMRQFSISQRIENTVALGLNIIITIFFPFFFLPFWNALLVCLCSNVPCSLLVVVQIAVNHEVPETMSKTNPDNEMIDWGVHQVLTSHNFGVDSPLALHMSGGLNMQIEHHLFPSVHYTHYPALSLIVKQACKEFHLPYNSSKHIFEAVGKHYNLLEINSRG